jgi:hypothetical protein
MFVLLVAVEVVGLPVQLELVQVVVVEVKLQIILVYLLLYRPLVLYRILYMLALGQV